MATLSRTPPGVRELKHRQPHQSKEGRARRTPPGVRELKPLFSVRLFYPSPVAPLPGCVN